MTASASTPRQITRDDLESKFRELHGEVEETKETVLSTAITVGAVVVVGVIAVAFLFGRRRGRRRTTGVEVRRI
jgi:hypothetical protein